MNEAQVSLVAGLLGALVAGLGTWRAGRWLGRQGHRYADERDLPVRALRWLVPVAVVTGFLIGRSWAHRPALAATFVVAVVVLLVLTAIDLDVHRLPDSITKPSVVLFALLLGVVALIEGDLGAWLRALAAGLALFLVYTLLVLVGPSGGMGFGDAKLAPTLGLLLGYLSWSHVLLATLAAFLTAGLAAVFVVLFKGGGRQTAIAFGPHMVIGALLLLVLPALLSP
ncbi:prepilin peptidase [Janibacter sp. G56]|uniref:prepilin peptidase n=1 Tax=Janibacter sp. G56 TaxID=3418717 RepID=UPI003D05EA5C